MSRYRSVKPEFWVSEQVILCSPLSRLLFIGMWNFCDDSGIHPASCIRLKLEVFPADLISPDEIRRLVDELLENGLLEEYKIDNKPYWQVTGWHHQKIDKPNYKYPDKSGIIPSKKSKDSINTDELDKDDSMEQFRETKIRRPVDDHSSTNRLQSRVERNRVEKSGKEEESSVDPSIENDVQEIFKFWQDTMKRPTSKFDKKRKQSIQHALKRHSKADLCKAITGCSLNPFYMGDNDRGKKYNDIELILRDAKHIEGFIEDFHSPPIPQKKFSAGVKTLQNGANVYQQLLAEEKAKMEKTEHES